MSNFYSRSPPPLQHPVPTHPAYIPDPPSTPLSPDGYQRFTSSPNALQQQQRPSIHQQQSQLHYQATPANAYTSPFQHNQSHLQQQHHQPRQDGAFQMQQGFKAMGMNEATAQIGIQLGGQAFTAGQKYVQQTVGIQIPQLKHHFSVSNSYVLRKISLVLFPWTHRPWGRKVKRMDNGQTEWQTPREDINSPDLYIPVMALVTYVLLAAVSSGLGGRFHPKILGDRASRALGVVLLDWLAVWCGCYILGVNESGSSSVGGIVIDLVAYGGYKFIGVIATRAVGLLTASSMIYILAFVYCFLANAFFLLRSLRSVLLPDAAGAGAGTVGPTQRRRRISFLFFEAVVQVVYMGILVRI